MSEETDWIDIVFRNVVLPVTIAVCVVVIGFVFDSRMSRRAAELDNLKTQLEGATETYQSVMKDAEALLSMMRYHAWNIAWRKMRPEGIFNEDLVDEDQKKWSQFDDALTKWRYNKIQNKRAIEIFFGKRENASRLFQMVDATFDKLSFEIWFIYHENPNNPNVFLEFFVEDIDQHYNTIFNAIVTSVGKTITREQEENVHRTVSVAFDELQDKINRMCLEMSEAIQNKKVGNLRYMGRKYAPAKPSNLSAPPKRPSAVSA